MVDEEDPNAELDDDSVAPDEGAAEPEVTLDDDGGGAAVLLCSAPLEDGATVRLLLSTGVPEESTGVALVALLEPVPKEDPTSAEEADDDPADEPGNAPDDVFDDVFDDASDDACEDAPSDEPDDTADSEPSEEDGSTRLAEDGKALTPMEDDPGPKELAPPDEEGTITTQRPSEQRNPARQSGDALQGVTHSPSTSTCSAVHRGPGMRHAVRCITAAIAAICCPARHMFSGIP